MPDNGIKLQPAQRADLTPNAQSAQRVAVFGPHAQSAQRVAVFGPKYRLSK